MIPTDETSWLVSLPAKASDELARRYPTVAIHDLETCFGFYVIGRNRRERALPKNDINRRLRHMLDSIARLERACAALETDDISALLREAAHRCGTDQNQARHAMMVGCDLERRIAGAAQVLLRQTRRHPRLQLLLDLIPMIDVASLDVNAKSTGALCSIAMILIEAAGDDIPSGGVDVRRAAREAVKLAGTGRVKN